VKNVALEKYSGIFVHSLVEEEKQVYDIATRCPSLLETSDFLSNISSQPVKKIL
jgi:hypothetical protein